jgi:cytidylate kinase
MNRPVITVDGLAGTGKTTLSERLAAALGYVHLSTGMLYRTVGLLSISEGVSRENPEHLSHLIARHKIALKLADQTEGHGMKGVVELDGEVIFDQLYTPKVSEATSEVAVHSAVREALISVQQKAFVGSNLIAEGRDMVTVIFKDAPLKFCVHTDEDIKVKRRIEQLLAKNPNISPEEKAELESQMQIEIHERDRRDQERGLAPSIKGADMILIDNSLRSIDEVLNEMLLEVRKRGL